MEREKKIIMDTNKVREQLLAKRDELQTRIDNYQAAEKAETRDDRSDGGSDHYQLAGSSEIRDGLDAEITEELTQIDAALARLDDNTYGTCSACGKAIAQARLEAVPYASTCIKCAIDNES